MEQFKTLKYPISTEKTIRLMEQENKLLFVVDSAATKNDVKAAFKEMFNTTPAAVNTLVRGKKKYAYITLTQDMPAIEIATQLGLM